MKEDRTGGRKEKEDRTRNEFWKGEEMEETWESTEHRCFPEGEQIHFISTNCLLSLTILRFIEIERRGVMAGRYVATVISALVDWLTRLGGVMTRRRWLSMAAVRVFKSTPRALSSR